MMLPTWVPVQTGGSSSTAPKAAELRVPSNQRATTKHAVASSVKSTTAASNGSHDSGAKST